MEEYEVYPGHTANDLARDLLSRSPISLQSFCKNERIDARHLPGLVEAVLTEWELKDIKHHTRSEAINHLINHIRTKSRNEARTNLTQRSAVTANADRYSMLERAADAILLNAPDFHTTQDD